MKTRIRIERALLALVGAGMVAGSLGACAQAGRGPDGGTDSHAMSRVPNELPGLERPP